MATIPNLRSRGLLHLFELPEWEGRRPKWSLWVASEFTAWANAKSELDEIRRGPRTLREHLAQTLSDFRCSERPPAGDLRRMIPNRHGVWKIHPPGLRLYGWFHEPGSLVVVAGALEIETKNDPRLNDLKMGEVRAFISKHALETSVVRGDILAVFPP